jgi:hypothetical protein
VLAVILGSFFDLVLPLAWLIALAGRKPRSWVVRALNLLGSALFVAFLVHAGPRWGIFGWYTRWALVAVAASLWLLAAARARGVPAQPRGLGGWASAVGRRQPRGTESSR